MTAVHPLPSWNHSVARSAILDFVARATKKGGAEFVPAEERVATFDNDGTLWCEQPLQLLDYLREHGFEIRVTA